MIVVAAWSTYLEPAWPAAPLAGACLIGAAYLVVRRRSAGTPGAVAAATLVLLAGAHVAATAGPAYLSLAGLAPGALKHAWNASAVAAAVVSGVGAGVLGQCVLAGRRPAPYADGPDAGGAE